MALTGRTSEDPAEEGPPLSGWAGVYPRRVEASGQFRKGSWPLKRWPESWPTLDKVWPAMDAAAVKAAEKMEEARAALSALSMVTCYTCYVTYLLSLPFRGLA